MSYEEKKLVYDFEEGNKEMRDLLGGKGANLAEMTKIGLPVPQGFTITTEACKDYYLNGKTITESLLQEINQHIANLESLTGKQFGGKDNPLLVSVRSGAKFSMPGMMDTILNLGLNESTVEALAVLTKNYRFAYDSYRRFIQMFGDVVLGIDKGIFEEKLDSIKKERKYSSDQDLTADDLKTLVSKYREIVRQKTSNEFPTDPYEQLKLAVKAVFDSWENDRAKTYRRLNDIPSDLGTAVNVQAMVFGNTGDDSGTGVAFTRNSSNGEKKLHAEFLFNAQGEDVVAGVRTPLTIEVLREKMPDIYIEFTSICDKLEAHYCDMQDIEFTIENGKLYILQTRNGKRTAFAAIKIAVDLVNEGLISKEEALLRVEPNSLSQLFLPIFEEDSLSRAQELGVGIAASPGAATGKIVFTAADALKHHAAGNPVVLVRMETSPDDIEGMNVAKGILTATGGLTSHAAVVARGMGKCCVSGLKEADISEQHKTLKLKGRIFKEGDYISLDGTTGRVFAGQVQTKEASPTDGNFGTFISWAKDVKTLIVRANADTPRDAEIARRFGAEGIGLCRTEHMFFEHDRINAVRQMILANTKDEREAALEKILPFQENDFVKLYSVMREMPVCVRLLDPPLHEFLPKTQEDINELAKLLNKAPLEVKRKVDELHEFNPMLGHRGIRLAITYPEIYLTQIKAIIGAAVKVKRNLKIDIAPEIMLPLVLSRKEMAVVIEKINIEISKFLGDLSETIDYKIGTMIELPRACVNADSIAADAEFFSFGTNDLTQTTLGFSRDDSSKFLDSYLSQHIFEKDPFETIDQTGVGKLVDLAVRLGRTTRPDIKLGVCGEHGGDPKSIEFFHKLGLTYVSCSPFRVPIAILSAAQATIRNREE